MAMAKLHSITIENRCSVRPSESRHGRQLFLSSLDLVWQDIHYNRRLLFYPSAAASAATSAASILRRSLSHALISYFPLAGRLHRSSTQRTSILCNDAGVDFISASTASPISALHSEAFQIRPFFQSLCPNLAPSSSAATATDGGVDDVPLLSVQVTTFADGGISVGICHSHVVADGYSLWNFMVHWAACARRLLQPPPPPPDLAEPCHDRELLALRQPSQALAKTKFVNFDMTDRPVDDGYGENGHQAEELAVELLGRTDGNASVDADEESVQSVFELATEEIAALKKEAGGKYTSYESMCAHFWQRIAAARSPDGSSDDDLMTFAVMANLRNRLTTNSRAALPPNFFGNAVMFGEVAAKVAELRREALAGTAERIHAAVENAGAEEAKGFMNWLEMNDCSVFRRFRPAGMGVAANMRVASSPRFPAYAVDFGWGAPEAARAVKCGPGEMVLFGRRKDGVDVVEVCVALPPPVLALLLQDPAFRGKPVAAPPPHLANLTHHQRP